MKVIKFIPLFILFSFPTDILSLDEEHDESTFGGITRQRQAAIYLTTARRKHLSFDFEGAIEYYSKILELYPNAEGVYVFRGNAKSALRNYGDAIADYTKAIELKEDNDSAYYERGRTKISAGDKEEGCKDLKTAEQLGNEYSGRFIRQFCS